MKKVGEESDFSEYIYKIKGLHCPSCEIDIERRLLEEDGILLADASTGKQEVFIRYKGEKPSIKKLNSLFQNDEYRFYLPGKGEVGDNDKSKSVKKKTPQCKTAPVVSVENNALAINKRGLLQYLYAFAAAGSIFFIYFLLQKSGITSRLTVDEGSALGVFFLFGIIAGFSSCAALVGGLVLSMSKSWSKRYNKSENLFFRYTPHILFNAGRLVSFTILGALLGAVGSVFSFSSSISSILAMLVALLMLILGLQMVDVPFFRNIRIGLPKFFSRWLIKKEHAKSPLAPFILGSVTFFLPCGFTITTQSVALISGDPVRGGLVSLAFAFGTLPMLAFIGITSNKFVNKKHLSDIFLKTAGILVVVFSFYTFNSQLNVLGLPSLSDINSKANLTVEDKSRNSDMAQINEEGKQVVNMSATAYAYSPNYFKVRPNVPVKWVIENKGVSGCTNAIISRELFSGEVLIDQSTVVKEFTPTKPGRYKFSCWMGMVSGIIDVVDESGNMPQTQNVVNKIKNENSNSCKCNGSCGGSCGKTFCTYSK